MSSIPGSKNMGVGAMGAVAEAENEAKEDKSPSLSLLQRLKHLREWQERQRQELLKTQAFTHTPSSPGPSLPDALREEKALMLTPTHSDDFTTVAHGDSTLLTTENVIPSRISKSEDPTQLQVTDTEKPSAIAIPVTSDSMVKSDGAITTTTSSSSHSLTPAPNIVSQGYAQLQGTGTEKPSAIAIPVTSDVLVKSAGAATTTTSSPTSRSLAPNIVSQGYGSPVIASRPVSVPDHAPVVVVAVPKNHPVKSVSFSKEVKVSARVQYNWEEHKDYQEQGGEEHHYEEELEEDEVRETREMSKELPIHGNLSYGMKMDGGRYREEREDDEDRRQMSPLPPLPPPHLPSSQSLPVTPNINANANSSYARHTNPEEHNRQDEGVAREIERGDNASDNGYDPLHTSNNTGDTQYSIPSASPLSYHRRHVEQNKYYVNESMDDLLGGGEEETRAPYRSEKYKSSSPPPPQGQQSTRKDHARIPGEANENENENEAVKNLIPPDRPFFSSFTQGFGESQDASEETPRPRQRFLKKGEGTARFRMRPMRLKSARAKTVTEQENENREEQKGGWQGSKTDNPKILSSASPVTPSSSQKGQVRVRVPLQSLHLQRVSEVHPDPVMAPSLQQSSEPSFPHRSTHATTNTHKPGRPAVPSLSHHSNTDIPIIKPPLEPLQTTHQDTTTTTTITTTTHNPVKPKPAPNPYQELEKQQRKEEAELSAFEKLEEMADDSSFSSNSSTVWGLLRQGQQSVSVSSTPVCTPPPLALQETPVVGSLNAKPTNLVQSHFHGFSPSRVSVGNSLPTLTYHHQHHHQQQHLTGLQDQHMTTSQSQQVDVKAVLEQLKAIVRLEGHSISDITESDIHSFLSGCTNENIIITHMGQSPHAPPSTSTPLSPLSAPHTTSTPVYLPEDPAQQAHALPSSSSTPISPPPAPPRPHHVHFASEGVQVLEYHPSDAEDEAEETLTDATSLDSDMITTSDLEALTQYSIRGTAVIGPENAGHYHGKQQPSGEDKLDNDGTDTPSSSLSYSSGDATLTEEQGHEQDSIPLPPQSQTQPLHHQPVVLSFSPPPHRPPDSASNYIWSIFGKERDAKKVPPPKPHPKKTTREHHPPPNNNNNNNNNQKSQPKPQKAKKGNEASVPSQPSPRVDPNQKEELEVHKTLLLAKVAELEKETKLFKKDNAKLQRLQQELKEERQKLEGEKRKLQEEVTTERRRFQEHIDRERNALWTERQKLVAIEASSSSPSVSQHQEQQRMMMEVVRLKEEVREMEQEAKRKETLHSFTVKKLNDKIKSLESENKKLKENNNSLQKLEKENQDLRLKLDNRTQAAMGGRIRPATQTSQTNKATRGKAKIGTRPTTIDGVTKTVDRLTKPQPVVIRTAQTRHTKADKQDIANNNINNDDQTMSVTDDAATIEQSNTKTNNISEPPISPRQGPEKAPPCTTTTTTTSSSTDTSAKHPEISGSRSLPWSQPRCGDEAGLEHTERLRDDGVREVIYANGNRKEIYPSGDVTVSFYNGDRKEVKTDRTVYVYGSDHTSHTTYSDGREELVFPSGQREERRPDGSSEIHFPDGAMKTVTSDGTEICTTKDGCVVRTNLDGSKVFEFPSGQREVHRGGEKRREYPNGTVKIVHPDGRTETRYNTGRIRMRDREGKVILDTHVTLSSSPPLHPNSSL